MSGYTYDTDFMRKAVGFVPTQGVGMKWCQEDVDGFDAWLVQVKRDAAREALGGLQSFARECMDGEHGEIDHETFAGWHHTWAAAMQHRVTHYPHPEEAP